MVGFLFQSAAKVLQELSHSQKRKKPLKSGLFSCKVVETAGIEPDAAPIPCPTENHNSP
tara:strand:- start:150 stop:326 length:177 start_codon:yes stop_codon:yes gene_type:complete